MNMKLSWFYAPQIWVSYRSLRRHILLRNFFLKYIWHTHKRDTILNNWLSFQIGIPLSHPLIILPYLLRQIWESKLSAIHRPSRPRHPRENSVFPTLHLHHAIRRIPEGSNTFSLWHGSSEQQHVTFRVVYEVMNPSRWLLDADLSPLRLWHQCVLRDEVFVLLRDYDVAIFELWVGVFLAVLELFDRNHFGKGLQTKNGASLIRVDKGLPIMVCHYLQWSLKISHVSSPWTTYFLQILD